MDGSLVMRLFFLSLLKNSTEGEWKVAFQTRRLMLALCLFTLLSFINIYVGVDGTKINNMLWSLIIISVQWRDVDDWLGKRLVPEILQ